MNVKEFKRFVREIPEEFDDFDLSYCDFSYCDTLSFWTEIHKDFNNRPTGGKSWSIGEGYGDNHEYSLDGTTVKTLPVEGTRRYS